MKIIFKNVKNLLNKEEYSYNNKVKGELIIIELSDCGVKMGEILRAGKFSLTKKTISSILNEYKEEIVKRTRGWEYPMVTIKITEGGDMPLYKQTLLFKKEFWIEIKKEVK